MTDKVKCLKLESVTDGGESDPFPTEVNPAEDYLAAKGLTFENSDFHFLELSSTGEIQYRDSVQATPLKLNDIGSLAFAARFSVALQHNGSVSNNTFFGYNELIPGNTTPVIIPVNATLKGFTFSNSSAAADFTLIFRKNGTTELPFLSVPKTNTQFFAQSGLDIPFNQGDQIYVQYSDAGTNANDVGLILIFQAI